MKKILNAPERVVTEMCHGLVLSQPSLRWDPQYQIISRKTPAVDKVCLISGGGSGHEPAHAGFVGKGMLDAAVCGDVFASPSQIQVYHAIRKVASPKGVLLVVKNYSGDIMNFKNAAYLASEDGIAVDYVKVDDDIAVQDSLYTVGRRGVAGTLFVHKLAGAAAERGDSLAEVKAVAEKTVSRLKSIGFAFSSCTVPSKGSPTFEIADDEMEYGVGIHGEPGIRREKTCTADELAKRMVDALVKELALTDKPGEELALLVNGLGGTPGMELNILNLAVRRELERFGLKVDFSLVGNFMTSIDMQGASVTLLHLDEELKALLHAPCNTPAWKLDGEETAAAWFEPAQADAAAGPVSYGIETDAAWAKTDDHSLSLHNIIYLVDAMSDCIIRNEVPFCELDSHAGDGDFGMSVAKGFRCLKEQWKQIVGNAATIGDFLGQSAMVIMEHCGGASGPIWGSAFRGAARAAGAKTSLNTQEIAQMLQAARTGVQTTGERSFGRGAVVGDKTLIDALVPFADTWTALAQTEAPVSAIARKAAEAAVAGAAATEKIVARMGRAGTVGERSLGYPDAGAYALGVIFTMLADVLGG